MAFKDLQRDVLELFAEECPRMRAREDRLTRSQTVEQHRERSEVWNAAHPLKCRKASEKYRAAHPEVLRAWKKANPEKVRAARLREFAARRARRQPSSSKPGTIG